MEVMRGKITITTKVEKLRVTLVIRGTVRGAGHIQRVMITIKVGAAVTLAPILTMDGSHRVTIGRRARVLQGSP